MKKLLDNKDTNENDIIEQEEIVDLKESNEENIDKKSKGAREWFTQNKIFFEIFSYVFVGVMGIVISGVGLAVNHRTANIYQKQLEILDNDREPYFSLTCETIHESRCENEYNIINKYTIKNDGGIISDAYLSNIKACVIIYVENDKYRYKYFLDGKYSIPNDEYIYNFDTKIFSFYGQESNAFTNFFEELERYLILLFDEYDVTISLNNYIQINYVNYKNERYNKVYDFSKDGIFAKAGDDVEKDIFLGESRFGSSEEAYGIAFNIYNYINEINKNHNE